MNKVMLMGRLTRDPMIRHAQSGAKVASYSLAVGRAYKGTDGTTADFPRCVCIFPKVAEFAEQHLRKGLKVIVVGRIQTGSYTNKDGQKVYTTDVIVESQEFAEGKKNAPKTGSGLETDKDGYLVVPDDIDDELPFA